MKHIIVPDDHRERMSKLFDVENARGAGAHERTAAQYAELLILVALHAHGATVGPASLIEAVTVEPAP